jgi:hypothetical protein
LLVVGCWLLAVGGWWLVAGGLLLESSKLGLGSFRNFGVMAGTERILRGMAC